MRNLFTIRTLTSSPLENLELSKGKSNSHDRLGRYVVICGAVPCGMRLGTKGRHDMQGLGGLRGSLKLASHVRKENQCKVTSMQIPREDAELALHPCRTLYVASTFDEGVVARACATDDEHDLRFYPNKLTAAVHAPSPRTTFVFYLA